MTVQRTVSPVDGRVLVERVIATEADIAKVIERASTAAAGWRDTPVAVRTAMIGRAIDHMVAHRDELAAEITWQMGRPLGQSPGEIRGLEERARFMLTVAPRALADRPPEPKSGFSRFMRREPLGLVFVIAPRNYPYLTAVNSIVPALAAGQAFVATNLELGGKDPAYVREDADLDHAIENLVDGACFNSGQSCCGIERIYVHASRFDAFAEGYAALAGRYILGDPTDAATNLGPMVRPAAADFARGQVEEAVAQGARALIDPGRFAREARGSAYMAPQCVIGVTHAMRIMQEESFAPIVGIMPVAGDDEAVSLMNDSRFGLTASIWTRDEAAAVAIGQRIDTGTCFMNRCDYLDPALAWVGVKDSGRGCALSEESYTFLTRPKSFHLRTGP